MSVLSMMPVRLTPSSRSSLVLARHTSRR
jgi:hypothetical protein